MDYFDGQVREYKGQVESKELETRKIIYEAVNPQCNLHHLHFDCHDYLVKSQSMTIPNVHKSESDVEMISMQSSGDSG